MPVKIKAPKSQGFKRKLTVMMCLFTLIPMLLLGFLYGNFLYQRQKQDILNQQGTLVKTAASNLSGILTSMERSVLLLGQNTALKKLLSLNLQSDTSSFFEQAKTLDAFLVSMGFNTRTIEKKKILIYSLKDIKYTGGYIYNARDMDGGQAALLAELVLTKRSSAINEAEKVLSFYGYCMSSFRVVGVLEGRVYFTEIENAFNYDIPGKSFIQYITDENGNYTAAGSQNVPGEEIAAAMAQYMDSGSAKGYYCLEAPVSETGRVVLFLAEDNISGILWTFSLLAAAVYIFSCIFIVLLIFLSSGILTKRLYGVIDKIGSETNSLIDEDRDKYIAGGDEFSIIGLKFYDMSLKIKEYYSKILGYEQARKEMEIKLLQERINPHFLYNTLSSLRWAFQSEKLNEIILSMTKYYRIVLSKGDSYIRLADEMEMLEIYLNIQSFTYDLKFTKTIQLDDGLRDIKIPKNILQPVVENAFLHGIRSIKREGSILISVSGDESGIEIAVRDNGDGIDNESLEKLMKYEEGFSGSASEGYGLYNVRKRLELEYGDKFDFRIYSEAGAGTCVVIRVWAVSGKRMPS